MRDPISFAWSSVSAPIVTAPPPLHMKAFLPQAPLERLRGRAVVRVHVDVPVVVPARRDPRLARALLLVLLVLLLRLRAGERTDASCQASSTDASVMRTSAVSWSAAISSRTT